MPDNPVMSMESMVAAFEKWVTDFPPSIPRIEAELPGLGRRAFEAGWFAREEMERE